MDENKIRGIYEYICKAFSGINPILGAVWGYISYIMFPDKMYLISLGAVLAAALLDIITKIYSICKKHGGYMKAVRKGKVFSKSLWKGTEVKMVSYLTIAILTGLSYRVVYLEMAGIALATFVYSVMFMREFQSNVENLNEAGADLDWLLLFSKKKNKELMKPYEENEETSDDEFNNYE